MTTPSHWARPERARPDDLGDLDTDPDDFDPTSDLDCDDECRCLADDCNEPAVFELRADCEEPYCEAHGPAMVVALIATPSTTPKHIDLVRLPASRNFALTTVAA